jgi:hydrogenase maturation protease
MARTLILYLGNPIVKNDQVGLIVGSRLAALFSSNPQVDVREFSGSPLDLVSDTHGYDRLILIDSISTGVKPIGSVSLFGEPDILSNRGDVYLHGMNLSEALTLCRRMQLPFPGELYLVGIEAGVIYEFSEDLSADLQDKIAQIIPEVRRIVEELLSQRSPFNSHP